MLRERLLVRSLVELADTLILSHDVFDHLYLLCERILEVVQADGAGVLLMNSTGALEVAATSSNQVRELLDLEVALQQGPGIDAHRTAERVDDDNLATSGDRWPDFAGPALQQGFRSVHARPLRLRRQAIGALSVLRASAECVSDDDAAVIEGMADMAAIGIVHERALSAVEHQLGDLQRALDRRAVVDQAMAVLADRIDVDQRAAFDRLRRYARNHNQRLRDVAQRFLNGELDTEALAPE